MSFTDQKPKTVTKKQYPGNWGGYKDGRKFRCYMCGHYFKIGDIFRWVLEIKNVVNILVCADCDGPDIIDRWEKRLEEYNALREKFWWAEEFDQ